uniref:DUF3574 domain-containing protein n=1 Tax=Desulfovibrio sp. U5L TaxID=596152 RepID=I2PZ96_9BACT
MSRRVLVPALCLLALLWCLPTPAQAETRQVFAHLFTVPTDGAGGTDAAARMPAFEAWLVASFGGYTRLGSGGGGWKNEAGQVEIEGNTAYLATADRDVSKEIAARLVADFGERVPYVLVFPAGLFAK